MVVGRRFGPARRTTTALLTGLLGVLAPLGAALPAWAQTAPADGYWATPPPVDESKRPADEGKPDKNYTQTKGCVQRSTLGQNIEIKNRPWGQEYLQISKAQDIVRAATPDRSAGGGIKVAVIDTGVTNHPWFQNRLESGGDYVAGTTRGQKPGLEDCDGHGTEVAGIIAAKPDNPEVGFVGVAPDATIVSFRQLSENYGPAKETAAPPASSTGGTPSSSTNPPAGSETQLPPSSGGGGSSEGDHTSPGQTNGGRQLEKEGTAGTLKTLAEILVRIADRGDIKVVNMSVDNCRTADGGITAGEQQVQAAIHYAASKDIVIVAAAGNVTDKCPQNDQPDVKRPKTIVTPPWFADDVLSVGAIEEKTGSVAPFSVHGPWVGVAAPGTKIISLDPAEGSSGLANLTFESGDKASEIQGTSFAAPYVAGLAALVRAKYPNLSAKQVVNRIKETAQHPAAPGGRDQFVGAGVIDPVAALTQILPSEVGNMAPMPSQQMAQLPPANDRSSTPVIVALAGTAGGVVALLITVFVMRTVRRTRPAETTSTRR
ncbi:S8 family serine peptidase [Amycolatopsis nalaikhensis]|uniref:S8 family serine peptidase n=1 Tax=Amycolatopsis nalaikhensis TaxID=715472 RepID=A0ABY8XSU5_9PSEU|nr:S8 family serine peptidase [Amycolatopsis sp. 2-2]WIV58747.1 S8 family serine peptidase [Amycolatopsis sp. 2-2]